MRAIVVQQYGPPEVLQLLDVPAPTAQSGEVAINVEAAAVGLIDVLFRRDGLGGLLPPPFTPGIEVAGRIATVGADVQGLEPGQRVVTLSRPGTAGYAEVAVVPASLAIPIDAALAPETAVSTIPNVVTALAALQEAARMNAGDDLLVAGATGGLASVFPGVAKALGAARVTGVVSRAENVEHAYDLGYDEVLVTDQLPTISATFHVIVDPVGGPTRRACLRLLRPMGRMITIGNASDTEEVLVGTNELWLNSIGVVGLSIGGLLAAEPDRALLLAATAIDLVRQGHVDVSHETLPLAGAAEAHRRIEARTARGRLVLTPQNEQRP